MKGNVPKTASFVVYKEDTPVLITLENLPPNDLPLE